MMRIVKCLVLIVCLGWTAFAQQDKDLAEAAKKGAVLPTQITVREYVSAQAVLIPRTDAKRIFGSEIAKKYAVIEVNVGNKSPDATLIIHGVFIDYSRWALSGATPESIRAEGDVNDRFHPFQTSTNTNHVASEELRVVRGQALDAQGSTLRNRLYRWLMYAGNLASAFTFSLSEKGIIQGIGVMTGVGVPGFATAFPDMTVAQLNRISDFGYKANTVVPKQGAEVIVCFFPIDRFLTPGFRKLYLKSPALFFSPLQMLVDTTIKKDVERVLGKELGMERETLKSDLPGDENRSVLDILRNRLPCYLNIVRKRNFGADWTDKSFDGQMKESAIAVCLETFGLEKKQAKDSAKTPDTNRVPVIGLKSDDKSKRRFASFLALDYLSQISLNNVSVTVDGIMTVDVTTIPAKIEGIEFDDIVNCGGDSEECYWADPGFADGVRTGTIPGVYLSGASLVIAEASALGITDVKTVADGSSDQALKFSFKMTKGIPTGTKLHFKLTKPKLGVSGATIDSQPWIYVVDYPLGPPSITKAELNGSTVTVTGTGFFNGPAPNTLVVGLQTPSDEVLSNLKLKSATDQKLVLDIPEGEKVAGCWMVLVAKGAFPQQNIGFVVTPSPTLTSAKQQDNRIKVSGTGFNDASECGQPITFQLVKVGSTPVDATGTIDSQTAVTLNLPPVAKEGTWTVKVLVGGKEIGSVALQR